MKLIDVKSAVATATTGLTDFTLTVTAADDGSGSQFDIPFTLSQSDTENMSLQVNAWLATNPSFTINPYVPPAVTGADVDAERDRRRALPLSVTLSVGTFQINMDPVSQTNIQGLSTVGLYLTSLNSTQTTPFRDYTNVSHDLSPSDLVSMGLQVAAHVQTLYTASWAIKSKNPIPTDFTNDSYWS